MSISIKARESYTRNRKPSDFNREHVWKQKEQKWAKKQQELEDRLHMLSQRKTNLYRQSDQMDQVQSRITSLITRDTSPEELRDLLELAQQEISTMNDNLENERARNAKDTRSKHKTLNEMRRIRSTMQKSGYEELVRQLDMSMDKIQSEDENEIGEEWTASAINHGVNHSDLKFKDANRDHFKKMLDARDEEIENLKLQLEGFLTERQNVAKNSKREQKKNRDEHDYELRKIEMNYKDKIEKLTSKLEIAQKKVIKLVDQTAVLENENFDFKGATKEYKTTIHDQETRNNDLLVQIEELQSEISTLRRENEYLRSQHGEEQDKSDQMSQKVHELQENLWNIKKHGSNAESTIYEQQKELAELRTAWQDAMHQIEVLSAERSEDSVNDDLSGIQQLSSVMLSKGGAGMNEKTRKLVKKLFGEDFSNVVNTYEEKIKNLLDQIEFQGDETQNLYTLLLNVTGALEMEDDMSGNLMMVREQLKNRKAEFEGGISKLKRSEGRNQNSMQEEIEELRVKLATQASENANLMMKVRNVDKKDRELDNLRITLEAVKSEQKQMAGENSKLRKEISSSTGEIKPDFSLGIEDFQSIMQCSAATIEELLEPPESILNESIEDDDIFVEDDEIFNESLEDFDDDDF